MNRAEHFRLVCEDVKAAQDAEDSIPAHLLFATEPMIRHRELPRDVAEEQHWEDRAFDQWAQDVADEADRVAAREAVYEHDERGALFPRAAADPGEYRDPVHGFGWPAA